MIGENFIIVRTPRSAVPVNTKEMHWRAEQQPALGMFIIAVGKWQGPEFVASQVKIVKPEELRFLRPHIRPMEGEIKR